MDRKEHGTARSGLITASIASVIMKGGEGAWDTLIRNLWSDDGSDFTVASGGARAFGLEHECVGRSLFWERHAKLEIDDPKFVHFSRKGFRTNHPYRRLLACSPDLGVLNPDGSRWGGGEIKSPTSIEVYTGYTVYTSRDTVPPEHVDQVFFSMWVTGWENWVFATHFNERYAETITTNQSPRFQAWVKSFRPKLDAFIAAYLEGKKPERDKLSASSLASLLRS